MRLEAGKTAHHSEPSTGDRPTIVCNACRQSNEAGQQFCNHCGSGLWEACLRCGQLRAVSERFCGQCGAQQEELVAHLQAAAEAALAKALTLARDRAYRDALQAVRSTVLPDHAELAVWQQRLAKVQTDLQQLVKQQEEQLARELKRIRQLSEEHRYAEVLHVVQHWPAAWLTHPPVQQLAEQARAAQREMQQLSTDIRQLAAAKRYPELLSRLIRYRQLDPDSRRAESLMRQAADQVLQRARSCLHMQRYDEAVKLVTSIPVEMRSDGFAEFSALACELAVLHRELRLAPVADRTLLELARRLLTLAPDDAEAAQLIGRLQHMLAQPLPSARTAHHTWSTTPSDRSSLEVPTQWWSGVEAFRVTPAADQVWQQHPGSFGTAIGLALQGLGRAAININLLPRQTPSLLTRWARGNRPRAARVAWGIDVGDTALKVVRAELSAENLPAQITECFHLRHPHPLSQPGREAARLECIRGALEQLVRRQLLKRSDVVAINLPARQVLGKQALLPAAPEKRMEELVQQQLRMQVPVPIDELTWGWAPLSDRGTTIESGLQPVLLLAARRTDAEALLRLCREAELPVDILQSGAVALHNFARYEMTRGQATTDETTSVLLDLGSQASTLVVSGQHRLWFRLLPVGGNDVTASLAREFQLTHDQAEAIKREPAKAASFHRWTQAVSPLATSLNHEFQRSLAACRVDAPDLQLHRVAVLGGGARLLGLLRHVRYAADRPLVT